MTRTRLYGGAAELVALKPDVLLASGPTAVVAPQEEAITIPVVFTQVNDPVGAGLVETLAHPGGNVTGVTRRTNSGPGLPPAKKGLPGADDRLVSLLFFHAGGAHAPRKIAIREAP